MSNSPLLQLLTKSHCFYSRINKDEGNRFDMDFYVVGQPDGLEADATRNRERKTCSKGYVMKEL